MSQQPDGHPVPPHETDPRQQRPLLPPGASAYSRPVKPGKAGRVSQQPAPRPPLALWQRRQRLGTWGVVLGGMAIGAGLLIEYEWYNKPVSVINGVCTTQLGQLYAAGHPGVARNCSRAALLDHVLGWLIIGGVVAIVAGFVALGSARHLRAGVAVPPQPAAPGLGGAVPFPPPPIPGAQPPGGTYPFPPSS